MARLQYIKQPGGMLRPANQADADAMQSVPNGRLVAVEVVQPRNPQFHRKFFALLDFTFDYWEPTIAQADGIEPEKNRERFRKDITILAGFRHAVVNLKNEVRYEADSISFASMDDLEFSNLYKAVFNVCWRMVLSKIKGMTEQVAENTINNMLSFD